MLHAFHSCKMCIIHCCITTSPIAVPSFHLYNSLVGKVVKNVSAPWNVDIPIFISMSLCLTNDTNLTAYQQDPLPG